MYKLPLTRLENKLSTLVGPAFSTAHRALKEGRCNQLVLKGGRGSGKSSFASIEGLILLLRHRDIHGVVLRKVAATLRHSVYAQYLWAIDALGLSHCFSCSLVPLQICYKPTGQRILFLGADDADNLKSLKLPFGYAGFLHFEELDQFNGEDEVRNIEQSVLRGGPLTFEIKSFNPPRSRDNWANRYCLINKLGQLVHHSDYRLLPEKWLGKRFLDDAAHLKAINPAAYEHEYLGEANGTGGAIFDNLRAVSLGAEAVEQFDRVMNGVDWGWYPDPWAFVRVYYHAARRSLVVFDEVVAHKRSNSETALIIKRRLPTEALVLCDAAEPKSISDYRSQGVRATAARKGPGSLEYSYKWLQSLTAIEIDPLRCPESYREFSLYEYVRGRQGEVLPGYPDANNHCIDAVRYATSQLWRRRGN